MDVYEFVETVREVYAQCRGMGHAWDAWSDFFVRPPSYGYRLSLRCTRCGTVRNDILDAYGFTVSRHYVYPEDYAILTDESTEHPTRRHFKLRMASSYGTAHVDE